MSEPETTYLEYGLTPFDSMPQADLLLHAKRLYDACNSMRSVLSMLKDMAKSQPYWTVGSGAQALEKGEQACDAVEHGYSNEDIYRSYYRYATDLLFESKGELRLGFDWHVCVECNNMMANPGVIKVGTPCKDWKEPACKGVYRLLTWDDLKPVKDEAA